MTINWLTRGYYWFETPDYEDPARKAWWLMKHTGAASEYYLRLTMLIHRISSAITFTAYECIVDDTKKKSLSWFGRQVYRCNLGPRKSKLSDESRLKHATNSGHGIHLSSMCMHSVQLEGQERRLLELLVWVRYSFGNHLDMLL